jgi:hypothetical protein
LVNEQLKDDPGFASLTKKKRQAHQLSVYLRVRSECWENESEEVKVEIQNIFDEEHGIKADEGDEEKVDGNESETREDEDLNDDDSNDEKILLQRQQE